MFFVFLRCSDLERVQQRLRAEKQFAGPQNFLELNCFLYFCAVPRLSVADKASALKNRDGQQEFLEVIFLYFCAAPRLRNKMRASREESAPGSARAAGFFWSSFVFVFCAARIWSASSKDSALNKSCAGPQVFLEFNFFLYFRAVPRLSAPDNDSAPKTIVPGRRNFRRSIIAHILRCSAFECVSQKIRARIGSRRAAGIFGVPLFLYFCAARIWSASSKDSAMKKHSAGPHDFLELNCLCIFALFRV
jgi:hypothetical protein